MVCCWRCVKTCIPSRRRKFRCFDVRTEACGQNTLASAVVEQRIRLYEIAVWKKSWRLGCLKRQRIHSLLHKKELLLSGKSLTNFITQMVRAFSTLHSDAGFVRCKYLRFRLVRPFYRTAIIQLIYLMCIYFQGTTRPQATCGTFNEDPSGSYFGSPSIFRIAPVVGERKTRVVKRLLKSSPPRCST